MTLTDDAPWTHKSPEDYFPLVQDQKWASEARELLSNSACVLEIIRVDTNSPYGSPKIFILNSVELHIEASDLRILVSPVFLDHCLKMMHPGLQHIGLSAQQAKDLVRTPPIAALMWALGHEYLHSVHKHHDAKDVVGSDKLTEYALERDADLSAAAAVFRIHQLILSRFGFDDITVRRFCYYCIFWFLRPFAPQQTVESSTHPQVCLRIIHINMKLISLGLTKQDAADPEIERPETKARMAPLLESLVTLEGLYIQSSGLNSPSVFEEMASLTVAGGVSSAMTNRWEEIFHCVHSIPDPPFEGAA